MIINCKRQWLKIGRDAGATWGHVRFPLPHFLRASVVQIFLHFCQLPTRDTRAFCRNLSFSRPPHIECNCKTRAQPTRKRASNARLTFCRYRESGRGESLIEQRIVALETAVNCVFLWLPTANSATKTASSANKSFVTRLTMIFPTEGKRIRKIILLLIRGQFSSCTLSMKIIVLLRVCLILTVFSNLNFFYL